MKPPAPSSSRPRVPITATLIVRNEAHHLDACLSRLTWCDEIIVLDMQSTDGSRAIAEKYADRVYTIAPYPIAEPARVFAAGQARNDWVLLMDPDEYMPAALVDDIQQAIAEHPDAGAFRLPFYYHFKGRPLHGTIWGGRGRSKWALIHRDRVRLQPLCNRLGEVRAPWREVRITPRDGNEVEHHWSGSYWNLLRRHLLRYAWLEAVKMHRDGKRFSPRRALIFPWQELNRCLRHYDGWRLGPRGFILSGIYFLYTLAYCWLLALCPLVAASNAQAANSAAVVGRLVYERGQSSSPSQRRAA